MAAPTFVTSDGLSTLYVADLSSVSRVSFDATGCVIQDLYSSTASAPYSNISALGLDEAGNLYVGDDTTAGTFILTGRVWKVLNDPVNNPAEVLGSCGVPPPPPPPPPLPGGALTKGSLFAAGNLTLPEGLAVIGTHVWEGDHGLGFCRLDAAPPGASAPFQINQATCNSTVVSPGQMAFDPATNFVYVPDNATKGRGVWRLSFNPISQTLGSPVLLANGGGGTGGNRASAVALGPDGKLYVVFGRNRNILRITNPAGSVATQIVESVGLVADRRVGPPAIAFVGEDLYLAENGVGVTVVSSARLCQNNNCTAFLTSSSVAAPTFITSDAGGLLYIADGSFVFRFNPATAVEEVYATGAIDSLGASIAFQNISALGLDSTGNLYIGDDTTAGAFILTGRVFSAPPPPPPGP